MPVHVDPSMPVHPLTIDDVLEMVRVGIIEPDAHVELLDGVLAEMSPQSRPHAYALRRLIALAAPAAAAAGLELNVQGPLDVGSDITLPEPDIAIAPVAGRDEYASAAILVVETGVTSVRHDLGRKADIYASAGVPDYWVLDVQRRVLVVHRAPVDGCYTDVRTLSADETVSAVAVDLAVPVASLL
ncbi:MAG: Uma2 family endonuclease [Actinomycetota bacterium]|nr:Uma2 family endonuclease [Actinomycetota bacterium]